MQLVIQAGPLRQGGEVFVLDMGEPVWIADLAEHLIRLSGLEPGRDIEVQFVGPRPGEKLFEELLTAEEGTDSTQHQRIFVARGAAWETDGWGEKFAEFATRFGEMRIGGRERGRVQDLLRQLVPTYHREQAAAQLSTAEVAAGEERTAA